MGQNRRSFEGVLGFDLVSDSLSCVRIQGELSEFLSFTADQLMMKCFSVEVIRIRLSGKHEIGLRIHR